MTIPSHISPRISMLIIFVSIGIILRLLIAGVGFTYDMQSYEIVGKIVTSGGNVYAQTSRYNYGPIWFFILGIFSAIASYFPDSFLAFRYEIVVFLTMVDVSIWYILYRRYSVRVSLLFFLNPVSIILTGYYSQFDNLAVLLGLLGVVLYAQANEKLLNKKRIVGLCLIGISLVTKHILFAFPLWLFISERGLAKRLLILCLPLFIFFASFTPFLLQGFDGIRQNVFLYSSFNNAPLWQFLVPDYLKRYITKELLFFGMVCIGSFVYRKKKLTELLLFYTITLVTFSYAVADQYFAIPLIFISVHWNIFFLLFSILSAIFFATVLLGGEVFLNPPGWLLARWNFSFAPMVLFLLVGTCWTLYRNHWEQISMRHIVIFLVVSNSLIYGCLIVPSYREDRRIAPIQAAIQSGDYEQANALYEAIEHNPPFAGSRFYEKLRFVRSHIEYYRTFRYALDGYENPSLVRDWRKTKKDLENAPNNFPEQEKVNEVLFFANSQL